MFRLLIVEDDSAWSGMLTRFLGAEGFDVRAVATHHEGVQTGIQFKPDLLIADWLLKEDHTGLDGIDMAHALRTAQPNLPIIFMTGLPRTILEQQIQKLHSVKIIEKPIEPSHLLSEVQRMLNSGASGTS